MADIIKDKFQAKWTGKRAKRIPAYDWCHEKITHSTAEGPEGPISGGWEWIADGNEKADRLANEGRIMPNVAEDTTHIIRECPRMD